MDRFIKRVDAWFWIYNEDYRNWGGIHFTARAEACSQLEEILMSLDVDGIDTRKLELSELAIDDERKISGGKRFSAYGTLRLIRTDGTVPLLITQLDLERTLCIEFNSQGMAALLEVIGEVRAGRGDTSIGVQSRRRPEAPAAQCSLWYWPCFGHLWVVP